MARRTAPNTTSWKLITGDLFCLPCRCRMISIIRVSGGVCLSHWLRSSVIDVCACVCVCAAEVVTNKLNGTRTEGETITIWLLQYKFNFVANSHNCHDIFIYRYRPSALLSASFNVIIFINNRCLCKIKQNMSCIPHLNTQTHTHAHIHSYATHVCETDLAMCEKKTGKFRERRRARQRQQF